MTLKREPLRRLAPRLATLLTLLALLALLALAWWAYRPGLSGDFLFDDFGNLPALGATGPVDHWATFWRYLTSGTADPTGRPLTLLTFLIDAHNWPASPYPFKVTNVILELINGTLLFGVLWRLGDVLLRPKAPGRAHARADATAHRVQLPSTVIPGLPAGQNPESSSAAAGTAQRLDSGSPLRDVRNDQREGTAAHGVRNDEGEGAAARDAQNHDKDALVTLGGGASHPAVIPGLPAGQNPESSSAAAGAAQRLDSGSPLRDVRNDEREGTAAHCVRNDEGERTAARDARNDDEDALAARGGGAPHPAVIPGLPAGQNPESSSAAAGTAQRLDSGSPLRDVRNDQREGTAAHCVRNDEGERTAARDARNDDEDVLAARGGGAPHPTVIPGLPAGQNPESSSVASSVAQRLDSGSPLRGVRNDQREGTAAHSIRNDEGDGTAAHGVRNDELGETDASAHGDDSHHSGASVRNAAAIAALFGAGAWLLHPLFVSATLYIVQREAMLPATFVLIGMLGWMAARAALARGHLKRALAGYALSAWLCTGLAVLSKANGALFPILLLLTEWIVLARQPMPDERTRRWHRGSVVAFLIIPSVLVAGYLVSMLPMDIAGAPVTRGWTVGQRLLTEPRVLADYLRLLFVPHVHSTGLFNDQFAVSKNWLDPGTTLPAIALVLGLIAAGFALRRRHPAIALALLFYFAAQVMESGWIPLELYFEHRNYLPAMLLFWPIGVGLARLRTLRWLGMLAAACVLLVLAGFTYQRATLWGDGFRQAQVWAAINPDSARAQANAALYDLAHNRPRLAAARLRLSMPRHPDDIQAPINLISAECRLGEVKPNTWADADRALAHTRLGGTAAFKWFDQALAMATGHACSGLDFAALQGTLDAARRNPHWAEAAGRQQDLHHLQGQLDLAEGKPQATLAAFNRALAVLPNPGSALEQAAYLGAHGYPQLGLDHLDYYATLPPPAKPRFGMPRIHAWVLREQGWWPKETAYLRKNLESDADAAARRAPATHTTQPLDSPPSDRLGHSTAP